MYVFYWFLYFWLEWSFGFFLFVEYTLCPNNFFVFFFLFIYSEVSMGWCCCRSINNWFWKQNVKYISCLSNGKTNNETVFYQTCLILKVKKSIFTLQRVGLHVFSSTLLKMLTSCNQKCCYQEPLTGYVSICGHNHPSRTSGFLVVVFQSPAWVLS